MLADVAAAFHFGLDDLGRLTPGQLCVWWSQAMRVQPELARGLKAATPAPTKA